MKHRAGIAHERAVKITSVCTASSIARTGAEFVWCGNSWLLTVDCQLADLGLLTGTQ